MVKMLKCYFLNKEIFERNQKEKMNLEKKKN